MVITTTANLLVNAQTADHPPRTGAHFRKRSRVGGFTLTETLVALGVLGLVALSAIQLFLMMNRQASAVRMMTVAKAQVIGRIQEVHALAYDPEATPAVVPTQLNIGTTTSSINLGGTTSPLGSVPATVTWQVQAEANALSVPIRRVLCRITYDYRGRTQNYEMVTFRAPD